MFKATIYILNSASEPIPTRAIACGNCSIMCGIAKASWKCAEPT